MTDDRRNPYVILGVPFGAGEKDARSGFANASRRLRQAEDTRYSMEDLTWALHQVEQMIEEPTKAFNVYRVPANPSAVAVDRPGVFDPEPEQIPRSTAPATDEERNAIKVRAIQELVRNAVTTEFGSLAIPKPYEQKEPVDGLE